MEAGVSVWLKGDYHLVESSLESATAGTII